MKIRFVSISTTILIGIILTLYLRANSHLFLALKYIPIVLIIELIILRVLFMIINGILLKIFIAKYGIVLTPSEIVGLPIITAMGNYLTPFSGGLVARVAYLNKKYAFPLAQFATLISVTMLITFWVMSILGSLLSIYFVGKTQHASWLIVILFLGTVTGISLLLILPTVTFSSENRILRSINTALQGWVLIRRDWSLLIKLALLSLINILLHGYSLWITYNALGFNTPFSAALLIGMMSMFSILVNITPANFGIQETFISLSSTLLGLDPGQSLLVALIIRVTTMIPIFLLGPLFSYILARKVILPVK